MDPIIEQPIIPQQPHSQHAINNQDENNYLHSGSRSKLGFVLAGIAVILVVGLSFSPISQNKQNNVLGAQTSKSVGFFAFFENLFSSLFSPKNNQLTITVNTNPQNMKAGATSRTNIIDKTAIPLGDSKVSTLPKIGYVYSCTTNFNGGGAEHAGDWINGDTWDLTKKISVEGNVSWPNAAFSDVINGPYRTISGNGLPTNSSTGIFPIRSTDPAFKYDKNPNSINANNFSYQIPAEPTIAKSPSCVPMGVIGYALNGVAIYNALDDSGRDAVAHEVQDSCDGHPQAAGQYHYHGPSSCMPHSNENNSLIGYALDGFGIYSMYNANGKEYTNTDLDECHGVISEVMWNGKMVNMYHYVLTQEYPYTIGCFKGTPIIKHVMQNSKITRTSPTARQAGPFNMVGPKAPQAAIDACSGKLSGSSCSFTGYNGSVSGTCRTPLNQTSLVCMPAPPSATAQGVAPQ